METTETRTKKWREPDGTEVIETTTIRRISPSNTKNSSTTVSNISKNDTSATVNYDSNQFEKDSLNRHNYYRAKHGVPNLVLSKQVITFKLCEYAQEWANNLAKSNAMKHRTDKKHGENIYMKGGTNVTIHGNDAVDAWYDEIHQYNFNSPGFKPGIGHFTQVVWKGSKKLGIAFAKKGSSIFVVANYDPPGNFQGEFKENVPRPK
ncbi:hypothetical protein BLA29_009335 [Euroglyphus maynei]|uniref:SCP domain-containing protein n=1 Tax=Euroglyphus maynei TaxID=6958 RepID=A0A1Y3B6Q2_EURMA|nr:hypothetical protein BLA29_009335 [Euroglyphus maynei]